MSSPNHLCASYPYEKRKQSPSNQRLISSSKRSTITIPSRTTVPICTQTLDNETTSGRPIQLSYHPSRFLLIHNHPHSQFSHIVNSSISDLELSTRPHRHSISKPLAASISHPDEGSARKGKISTANVPTGYDSQPTSCHVQFPRQLTTHLHLSSPTLSNKRKTRTSSSVSPINGQLSNESQHTTIRCDLCEHDGRNNQTSTRAYSELLSFYRAVTEMTKLMKNNHNEQRQLRPH